MVRSPGFTNPADGSPASSRMCLESKSPIHKLFLDRLDHLPHYSFCSYFLFPARAWIICGSCGTRQEALISSEPNPVLPLHLCFLTHPWDCRRSILGPEQDAMSLGSCDLVKAPGRQGSAAGLSLSLLAPKASFSPLKGCGWNRRKNFPAAVTLEFSGQLHPGTSMGMSWDSGRGALVLRSLLFCPAKCPSRLLPQPPHPGAAPSPAQFPGEVWGGA